MKRRGPIVAGALLLVVLVGGALVLLSRHRPSNVSPTDVRPEPFDRQAWHEGNASRRVAMGRHFADTGALVGRRQAELEAMLGPPSRREGDLLEWYLGPRKSGASLMFNYEEHLVVRLDADGTVLSTFVESRD